MSFDQVLKKIRMDKGIEMKEFAKLIGVAYATYHTVENNPPSYQANSIKKVMNPKFYTEEEFEQLKNAYEIKKEKDIVWLKESKKKRYEKVQKTKAKIHKEINSKTKTISEVPDFYEKLNALGDLEMLNSKDKGLIELQKELGVRR